MFLDQADVVARCSCTREGWRSADVGVTGRRGDFDVGDRPRPVRVWPASRGPVWCSCRPRTGLARSPRWSCRPRIDGDDVVGVPDRGPAPGGPAGPVPHGQAAGAARWGTGAAWSPSRPATRQWVGRRPGAATPWRPGRRPGRGRRAAGIGPPPTRSAGSSPPAQQRLLGHDQLHLDRDRVGGGLSGDPLDQGVGHDLAPAARVAGGGEPVGLPGQRGVGGDALGDRQEPAQPRHRVRRRPQRHRPVLGRALGAVHERLRVQPVGHRPGGRLHLPVTQPGQAPGRARRRPPCGRPGPDTPSPGPRSWPATR